MRRITRSLSPRLEAVLALLEPCRMLVDVGTDHGLLPIAAVRRGIAARAIASDLRHAPLIVAQRNIVRAHLSQRVALLRQDGLQALAQGAVDAVVIAGMGGEQMMRLLRKAPRVLERVSQLVVQPNGDALVMRGWAREHGWHVRDESMLFERDRFFVTCAFQRGIGADPSYEVAGWTDEDLCLVGPRLLARHDPVALRFYTWQCQRLAPLVARSAPTLQRELAVWQAARAFVQSAGPPFEPT